MRKLLIGIALALALTGGFLWGFFAHRNHVFPYWTVKAVARPLGLTRLPPAAPPRRHELWPEQAEALRSLPYVAGTRDSHPELLGVIRHVPEEVSPGVNLYSPVTQAAAYLIDPNGRALHEWSYGEAEWQHTELLPDGSLLATAKDRRLLKLDRESDPLWEVEARFHHSLWVEEDGTIHALTRREERRPEIHPDVDCLVDSVTVISPDGEVLESVSLLDVVQGSPYAYLLPEVAHRSFDRDDGPLDVLHTNHVEVFDGRLAHRSPLFARGNLLVSFRTLSTIAVLDGETREILWAWGPNNLAFQHRPTLLEDGHLLIFDNGPPARQRSEVLELDPLEGRIVWRYGAEDFFSKTRGSAQRLPNGNTLITESDTGYAFEVTPEGERVWVFADPHFTEDGRREGIWWMERVPPEALGWLERRTSS